MYKVGEYVKVIHNEAIPHVENLHDWVGKVQEINIKSGIVLIDLDAQTLDSLSDAYLLESERADEDPKSYYFEWFELERCERRDTDEQLEKATDNLYERTQTLYEATKAAEQTKLTEWLNAYPQSPQFNRLTPYQQEYATFIVINFTEYMSSYWNLTYAYWDEDALHEVCLGTVPEQLAMEPEIFENYGDVLISFFEFLQEKNELPRAQELIEETQRIKDQIPVEAQNPENWGSVKHIVMNPDGSVSPPESKKEKLERALAKYQEKIDEIRSTNKRYDDDVSYSPPSRNVANLQDPFKGIGRNDKINVRYKDGRVTEQVKFKKVEADLQSGACEMI